MPHSNRKQESPNADNVFIAAERFESHKNTASLEMIEYKASLAADRARVAALDGESTYSASTIKHEQALAAIARTEIILRQIFN